MKQHPANIILTVIISVFVAIVANPIIAQEEVGSSTIVENYKPEKLTKSRLNLSFSPIGNYGLAYISAEVLRPNIGYEIPFNFLFNSDLEFSGFTTGINLKFYPFKGNKWLYVGPMFNLGLLFSSDSYGHSSARYEVFTVAPGVKYGIQLSPIDQFGIFVEGNSNLFIIFSDPSTTLAHVLSVGINFTF